MQTKTITVGTEPMTEELLKQLALMQHNGDPYFMVGTNAYVGTPEDNEGELVEEYDEDNNDYLVLTDEEATDKATEYIEDSLWAFTPSFLAEQTDLPEEVFQAIADNGKCESNNDVIERTIEDMDSFIDAAISADGRGHFMSSYDGEENEETVLLGDQTGETLAVNDMAAHTFYIYRIN